jgi:hypothetical protein
MIESRTTIIVLVVAAMAVLGLAAFVAIPMQEASASLVNVNGNKVLSNNQNKGKGGNNNCLICIGR